MFNVTNTVVSGQLTQNSPVEGTSVGRKKNGNLAFVSTWAGAYDSTRPSEHDGEMVHVFTNGHINGALQTVFTLPVGQF